MRGYRLVVPWSSAQVPEHYYASRMVATIVSMLIAIWYSLPFTKTVTGKVVTDPISLEKTMQKRGLPR